MFPPFVTAVETTVDQFVPSGDVDSKLKPVDGAGQDRTIFVTLSNAAVNCGNG